MDKKLNKRKCKHCGEEFQKIRPLDMFCSPGCAVAYKKDKQALKADKPNKPVKRKPIAPVSEKRLEQLAEYRKLRKEFLSRYENKFCPVMKHIFGRDVHTTEIHHVNGRENERLNDVEFWLAVSREGHRWIHEHPKESRELGWLK